MKSEVASVPGVMSRVAETWRWATPGMGSQRRWKIPAAEIPLVAAGVPAADRAAGAGTGSRRHRSAGIAGVVVMVNVPVA